jgi:signal transduction histidine kinase
MLTPQVFHLPHFLEDQYVWLSIAAWGVLLTWLWPRISRRRLLMWLGLTAALHLTPVTAQVIRATSAITVMAHDMPVTFWALQGVNVLVLAMIVSIWYVSQRRVARYRQLQAVLAERRRIANDLHDGVGSRLVALLASQDPKSAEPDGLSMALQACLLELQMTVDDLDDQTSATVAERLGHLRYRLQPAFDRLGIALEWHVSGVAHNRPLPPETAVQICRVAQEALSKTCRKIIRQLAAEIKVGEHQVKAAVELLDGGATVPFIARYRKEATGGLDDIQLRELEAAWATCASSKTAAKRCSRASTSRAS